MQLSMEAALNDKTAKVPLNLTPPIHNLTPIISSPGIHIMYVAGGAVVTEREAAESSQLPLEGEGQFGVLSEGRGRQQPGTYHRER